MLHLSLMQHKDINAEVQRLQQQQQEQLQQQQQHGPPPPPPHMQQQQQPGAPYQQPYVPSPPMNKRGYYIGDVPPQQQQQQQQHMGGPGKKGKRQNNSPTHAKYQGGPGPNAQQQGPKDGLVEGPAKPKSPVKVGFDVIFFFGGQTSKELHVVQNVAEGFSNLLWLVSFKSSDFNQRFESRLKSNEFFHL